MSPDGLVGAEAVAHLDAGDVEIAALHRGALGFELGLLGAELVEVGLARGHVGRLDGLVVGPRVDARLEIADAAGEAEDGLGLGDAARVGEDEGRARFVREDEEVDDADGLEVIGSLHHQSRAGEDRGLGGVVAVAGFDGLADHEHVELGDVVGEAQGFAAGQSGEADEDLGALLLHLGDSGLHGLERGGGADRVGVLAGAILGVGDADDTDLEAADVAHEGACRDGFAVHHVASEGLAPALSRQAARLSVPPAQSLAPGAQAARPISLAARARASAFHLSCAAESGLSLGSMKSIGPAPRKRVFCALSFWPARYAARCWTPPS